MKVSKVYLTKGELVVFLVLFCNLHCHNMDMLVKSKLEGFVSLVLLMFIVPHLETFSITSFLPNLKFIRIDV